MNAIRHYPFSVFRIGGTAQTVLTGANGAKNFPLTRPNGKYRLQSAETDL